MSYYNFRLHTAVSYWDRRLFLSYCRRIYGDDGRWTPPNMRTVLAALDPENNPHLARLNANLFYFDGLRRRKGRSDNPAVFESPLVTAVLQQDPRRHDRTAYLSYLHCANSTEAFLDFQDKLVEELSNLGLQRLIGSTGLSPHIGSGVLQNQWHLPQPHHAPYNPPYLPEILARRMRPIAQSQLFHFAVPAERPSASQTSLAKIRPLHPHDLATTLLPVLAAACQNPVGFAPPDALEVRFWQQWLGVGLHGSVAWVEETPVGFVLLLPDLAERLRRTKGGRGLWWLGLAAVQKRPAKAGRLLLGGVLPAWQGQGIGQQLWQKTIQSAQEAGWQTLTIGPVWDGSTAVPWLQKRGAEPKQKYQLYERTF